MFLPRRRRLRLQRSSRDVRRRRGETDVEGGGASRAAAAAADPFCRTAKTPLSRGFAYTVTTTTTTTSGSLSWWCVHIIIVVLQLSSHHRNRSYARHRTVIHTNILLSWPPRRGEPAVHNIIIELREFLCPEVSAHAYYNIIHVYIIYITSCSRRDSAIQDILCASDCTVVKYIRVCISNNIILYIVRDMHIL